jgi:RimJ/RimL family protein N-acetyltransferase
LAALLFLVLIFLVLITGEGEIAMEGKLVRLRGIERVDLDSIMKWIVDEEVTNFLGGEMLLGPMSRIAEEKFIESASQVAHDKRIFVIETLADRRYLGSIDLHNINWVNRSAEAGIVIGDKPSWGKGYGTDAMRVLLRFAFDKLNLNRVSLRVFDFQPARHRVLREMRFQARRRAAPG